MISILIGGPTASGKTALALELAEKIDGEIVNADAMQVYRDLRILTARPSSAEEARAPHHLFGFLDGGERCSAGRWARAAAECARDIARRGRAVIFAGGSGLYFRALVEGFADIPDVPDEIREKAIGRRQEIGAAAFYDEVRTRDPAAASLHANDRQRLIRAWEVFEFTGRPLSEFQARPARPLIPPPHAKLVLTPDRAELYRRIERRLISMAENGALEEVRALMARRLDSGLPVMKALGAPEFSAHLRGEIGLEQAIENAQLRTRHYAKRQLTWFRGQAADWPVAESVDTGAARVMEQLAAYSD
ncbi:MAG: tRNA (adenosine(37)-N6)-dimethylallyltransferase MiaA [Parvularculaceae bacterium]